MRGVGPIGVNGHHHQLLRNALIARLQRCLYSRPNFKRNRAAAHAE